MLACSKTKIVGAAALMVMAVAVTGITVPASAQRIDPNEMLDRLLDCDKFYDPTRKLTCYDTLVKSLKSHPSSGADGSQPVAAPAAAVTTTARPLEANPKEVGSEPVTPPAAAEPTAVAAPAARNSTPADFGLRNTKNSAVGPEKVKEEEELRSVQGTIVRVWKTSDRRFAIELDNGQVWRETSGSRIRTPKEGRRVNITEGRFGAYRMKVESIKRQAYVRREK